MRNTSITTTYRALGSAQKGPGRRSAVWANTAAGLTALLTGGLVTPCHSIVGQSARRLIGVLGIASDAAHFDLDARHAIMEATREKVLGKAKKSV